MIKMLGFIIYNRVVRVIRLTKHWTKAGNSGFSIKQFVVGDEWLGMILTQSCKKTPKIMAGK